MKTPLGGSSHFILFFRPVYLLSHLLSPCPQHKAAGKPPAPTGSSSPRPPPFPVWQSSKSHRSQALPPCFLSSSSCFLTAHGFGPCQAHGSCPMRAPQAVRVLPSQRRSQGGPGGHGVGREKQGKRQGGGEQPPRPAAGPPSTNAVCQRGGGFASRADTAAHPRDVVLTPKQGHAPSATAGGSEQRVLQHLNALLNPQSPRWESRIIFSK